MVGSTSSITAKEWLVCTNLGVESVKGIVTSANGWIDFTVVVAITENVELRASDETRVNDAFIHNWKIDYCDGGTLLSYVGQVRSCVRAWVMGAWVRGCMRACVHACVRA